MFQMQRICPVPHTTDIVPGFISYSPSASRCFCMKDKKVFSAVTLPDGGVVCMSDAKLLLYWNHASSFAPFAGGVAGALGMAPAAIMGLRGPGPR